MSADGIAASGPTTEETSRRSITEAETARAHGERALASGNPAAAVSFFEVALAHDPGLPGIHGKLGSVLDALGRPAEALAHYQYALEVDPNQHDVLVGCGNALMALGRAEEALARFLAALAVDPNSINAQYNAGTVLYALGRTTEAVDQFERLLVRAPDHAHTHNNLGAALRSLGRNDEAMEHYRRAMTLRPDLPDPIGNIGTLLMEIGMIDAAEVAFSGAIALEPHGGRFYLNLASVHVFRPGDVHLAAMERLVGDPAPMKEDDRVALHFALGKAYDDLGVPARAMTHLSVGNALQRRRTAYDEKAVVGQIDRIRTVFDQALFQRLAGTGHPSPTPVFVIGMPRSGTTLVEQMLASHPQIHGAGELYHVDRIAQKIDGFPEAVGRFDGADPFALGREYLSQPEFAGRDAMRVTDKMPWNFRYVGLIHLMLPNARFVHLRRDPVAVCLSCYSKLFTKNQEFSNDLGELGRYYCAYHALMDHWRAVLPTGVMIDVDYEALVDDFERQARRIVGHCGLPWDDACLSFHRTSRPVRTASATQVRKPIYRESLRRWHRYREFVGPLIAALGPDLVGPDHFV